MVIAAQIGREVVDESGQLIIQWGVGVGVERDLAILPEFLIPTGILEPIDPISPIRSWILVT